MNKRRGDYDEGAPAKHARGDQSSRQVKLKAHVTALNNQFARWVAKQQAESPSVLWNDGVNDYLKHAAAILHDFKDVVDAEKQRGQENGVGGGGNGSGGGGSSFPHVVPLPGGGGGVVERKVVGFSFPAATTAAGSDLAGGATAAAAGEPASPSLISFGAAMAARPSATSETPKMSFGDLFGGGTSGFGTSAAALDATPNSKADSGVATPPLATPASATSNTTGFASTTSSFGSAAANASTIFGGASGTFGSTGGMFGFGGAGAGGTSSSAATGNGLATAPIAAAPFTFGTVSTAGGSSAAATAAQDASSPTGDRGGPAKVTAAAAPKPFSFGGGGGGGTAAGETGSQPATFPSLTASTSGPSSTPSWLGAAAAATAAAPGTAAASGGDGGAAAAPAPGWPGLFNFGGSGGDKGAAPPAASGGFGASSTSAGGLFGAAPAAAAATAVAAAAAAAGEDADAEEPQRFDSNVGVDETSVKVLFKTKGKLYHLVKAEGATQGDWQTKGIGSVMLRQTKDEAKRAFVSFTTESGRVLFISTLHKTQKFTVQEAANAVSFSAHGALDAQPAKVHNLMFKLGKDKAKEFAAAAEGVQGQMA